MANTILTPNEENMWDKQNSTPTLGIDYSYCLSGYKPKTSMLPFILWCLDKPIFINDNIAAMTKLKHAFKK